MEALIKQIVQLEQKGKDIVKTAREREAAIEDEIAQNKALLESEIKSKLQNKLEQIRQTERTEGVERVAAIEADKEKQLAAIHGHFEQNRQTWEDQLFNRIIGR